ncbi:hypothetical protein [Bifidobacterium mongoliense]|uniref:hypothetical protein n=1 Tax=Bifidobacterium mongoliense TaxID=518643 RepID=UPI0030EF9DD1
MGETAALHELVAQLHDIGNSLDTAIDSADTTEGSAEGRYMGHTAKYWHGQFCVKDRRCERLSRWKREHSNAE